MSLYPAFLGARKRKQEPAPEPEPPLELEDDSDALPVFELVPPEKAAEETAPEPLLESPQPEAPRPEGRNVHTIGISDLTRLAIDNDGRLYWDGKPVEVSRRIMMSRKQVFGMSLIAMFVVIGAIGAALQGAAAARDWSCRMGWSSKLCVTPVPNAPKIPV